ncbi:hypothetical protein SLE2022_319360 [Rubroshorea leprosula]
MAKTLSPCNFIPLLIAIALPLSLLSTAVDPPEVGSAARCDPPYTPNACGIDEEHLPSNGLVGAVDEELWNKAGTPPCGAIFQVRCIEGPGACRYGTTVNVTITDRIRQMVSAPSSPGVRFALSSKSYGSIADPGKDSIKIQYQKLS